MLAKEHKKLGVDVTVALCNPLDVVTQEGQYESDPASRSLSEEQEVVSTATPVLDPIEHSISPLHAQYLKSRASFLDGIKKDFQVSIDVKESSLTIVPSKSSSQLAEVAKAIDALLQKLQHIDIHIPSQASSQAYPFVMIYCTKHDLQCIGSKGDVTTVVGDSLLLQQLRDEVGTMCDAIVQKTESIRLSLADYVFLKECTFSDIKKDHSHIVLKCQNQSLVISGSIRDIKFVRERLSQYLVHSEVPINLDPLIILFLKKSKGILLKAFQGHQVVPFWKDNDHSSLVLLTRSESAATLEQAASSLVMQQVGVVQQTLPQSFKSEVAETEKFSRMTEQLHKEHCFTSSIDPSSNCLEVVSVPADAKIVLHKFMEFINQECFKTVDVSLKRGVWRLVHTTSMKEKWSQISEKLRQSEVSIISCSKPENTGKEAIIRIKGELSNIDQAAEMVRQLQVDVQVKQMPLIRPGIYHYFFEDKKGKKLLAGIERDAKVCIEISVGEDDYGTEAEMGGGSIASKFQRICCSTDRRKTVNVYVGDITEFSKAEVIVNAANEDLQHIGGVANAIATKGGPVIQSDSTGYVKRRGKVFTGDAVLFNRVGNLPPPYKAIVHGVGPRWNPSVGKETNMALLRKTVVSCLDKAKGYGSIAMPAISSGVFGFPPDACADALFQAVVSFNPSQNNLNEVNFIINSSMSNNFVRACKVHMSNVSDFTTSSPPISSIQSLNLSTADSEFTTSDVGDFVVRFEIILHVRIIN